MYRRCCCQKRINDDIYFQDMMEFSRKTNALIIDVRSKQEFAEWHVDGSINIPVWDIKEKIRMIDNNYQRYIVLYCSSGIRSRKAQQILKKIGYKNVYNVVDGFYG